MPRPTSKERLNTNLSKMSLEKGSFQKHTDSSSLDLRLHKDSFNDFDNQCNKTEIQKYSGVIKIEP